MDNGGQSRRELLGGATAALGAALTGALPVRAANDKAEPFMYMLNTSTIQGQKLSLVEEIEVASRCGYQAIEPWIRELDQYVKDGGNLKDLGKRIKDAGLTVESSIGFAEWIVDDDARRKKGLEQAKRDMDMVRQIGGKRMAAPPAGATDRTDMSLLKIAERYGELFDAGARIGVTPMVELWGFSKTLSRLSEAMAVALDSDRAGACVLVDIYHLYKGGSGFTASLRGWLSSARQPCRSFTSMIIRRAAAERVHGRLPRLPRRRHRAAEGSLPRPERDRLSKATASSRWNCSTMNTGNTTRFSSRPAPTPGEIEGRGSRRGTSQEAKP